MMGPRLPQKASAQHDWGLVNVTFTVWLSVASTFEISRYDPTVSAAVAGSVTYSHVNATSAAVKGLPSCQVTPFLRRHVTHVRSRARVPAAVLGTSAARTGVTLPSGSKPASGS